MPLHAPEGGGGGSAVAEELAKFSALADKWWDPEGEFKPLHQFNPVRLTFLRDGFARHFGRDAMTHRPFEGLTLLDVGCGGGLLCEPLARMGFSVTGIDAAKKNIGTASVHAERNGLDITYRCATPEILAAEGLSYDVVVTMEVVEHVADPGQFLRSVAGMVRPGGAMAAATLNRTMKSLAMAKIGAEYVLRWLPPGTHDWRKFVKPSEMIAHLRAAGMSVKDLRGMTFTPVSGAWSITRDVSVNYMLWAEKGR
ncbi:MAG: bifunctional 2-polyprenyl-6-hydroxyphenol methylase/3-demethylubiquinol 3-O-methyltransferase UbiG [Rhodospirillaceae bacterium]